MNGGRGGSGFGDRMSLVLRMLLILVWAVILGGLVALALSARNSDDIVIERIDVPPELVPDGLQDEALARRILHELTVLRSQTADPVLVSHVTIPAGSWLRDYRVEVPHTGLSVADLYIGFRRWLGNDIPVRGGVYKASESEVMLALWVRGEAAHFKLERDRPVIPQIAEHIYARSFPSRYAYWVSGDPDRLGDAIDRLRWTAFNHPSRQERALSMNFLAILLMEENGGCEEAIELFGRARAIDPRMPTVLGNLSNAHYCLGRDQEATDATVRELALLADRRVALDKRRRQALQLENGILLAGARGHHLERLKLYERMETEGFGFKRSRRAIILAENKDFAGAMTLLKEHLARSGKPSSEHIWMCYKYFEAREQWPEASKYIADVGKVYQAGGRPYILRQLGTQIQPLHAIALARSGDLTGAQAVLDQVPANDCYLCSRSRGALAEERRRAARRSGDGIEARKQAEEADRFYADAVRLAPKLPFAYLEWGRAKLARGDVDGAIALFAQSRSRGPRWAEPLKYWADALVMKGHFRGAAVRYRKAARSAPHWFALHWAWGNALNALGERGAAAEKLAVTSRLSVHARDLSWLIRTCDTSSDQLREQSDRPTSGVTGQKGPAARAPANKGSG